MKHTPTPWHVDTLGKVRCQNDEGKGFIADPGDGKYYDSIPRDTAMCRANAEYIVKAVNLHAEMLEALKNVVAAEDRFVKEAGVPMVDGVSVSIDAARAIIAKAEANQ